MTIKLHPHTIYLLIGPSGCGKSYLVNKIIEKTGGDIDIAHISSDNIRRDILGKPHLHKYDPQMMHVSKQAFDMLYNKLDNLTSYPVNRRVVFVDTKGISKPFRDEVLKIAEKNNYNVGAIIFDYKDTANFYKFTDQEYAPESTPSWVRKFVSKDISRLHREAQPDITKRKYNQIIKITEPVGEDLQIIEDHTSDILYTQNSSPWIIGDVHGCFDEFQNFLAEYVEENEPVVLVGDIIDKGPKTREIVEFLYENLNKPFPGKFTLILGNHENYVFKRLLGEIDPADVETEFFDSISLFEQDGDLKNKFLYLVSNAYTAVQSQDFIISHAPCRNIYLGKTDDSSKKRQRNIRLPRIQDFDSPKEHKKALESTLSFLPKEAEFNQPFHIFGHIGVRNNSLGKNKICVDNDCVGGNRLTGVKIQGGEVIKRFVPSLQPLSEEDTPYLFERSELVDLEKLDPKEVTRIKYCAKDKVQFFSGTMSPADKNEEGGGDLESLKKALEYYSKKNVQNVVIQQKYMGSRCIIHLSPELDKCYAVSRNGYNISKDRVDLTPVYTKLQKQFSKDLKKLDFLILDGELLPWSAMGKGLIKNQFQSIADALDEETYLLGALGFQGLYHEAVKVVDEVFGDMGESISKASKEAIIENYGHHKWQNLQALRSLKQSAFTSAGEERESTRRYQEQLALYAEDGEVEYKPFALLKKVYKDGNEEVFISENIRTEDVYTYVTKDEYLTLNLKNLEDAYKKAEGFFTSMILENRKMEGLVIKPEFTYYQNTAPYLKVRTRYYLTLVYGYNYMHPNKFKKLMKQKKIGLKLSTSIKEYEIGKKLLEIPYKDISFENPEYVQLIARMITEEKRESEIDPRL